MFLLVLAYPGCPGQMAVKWLLLLLLLVKSVVQDIPVLLTVTVSGFITHCLCHMWENLIHACYNVQSGSYSRILMFLSNR